MALVRIMDCDAIVGFVDYGVFDTETNGGYCTKMRCKKCGAAWISENYIDGYDTCPECGSHGRKFVVTVKY